MLDSWSYKSDIVVSFEKADHAQLVRDALSVDPELRPHDVRRTMVLTDSDLTINFMAQDIRMLRAATGTFMDLLGVATLTLETFCESIKP